MKRHAIIGALLASALFAGGALAQSPTSGTLESRRTGDAFREPFKAPSTGSGPELVFVARQSFAMGSRESEPGFRPTELRHPVTVSAFSIGKFEVTNADYCAFLNEKGNQLEWGIRWVLVERPATCLIEERAGKFIPRPGAANRPVVTVSWMGARAYCKWLSERAGATYRLPTEAEWECAARAGTDTTWSWGDTFDSAKLQWKGTTVPADQTTPVGAYPPNPWGIHDMCGNVWEWVLDCFEDDYYLHSPSENPLVFTEECWTPEIRGGSFKDGPEYCRPGYRVNTWWWAEYPGVGFRVLREEAAAKKPKAKLGKKQ